MKFRFYFKNMSVLTLNRVSPGLFNNDDLLMVEAITENYTLKIPLNDARLIYFEKNGEIFLGKQETKRGVNIKTIFKLAPKEVILNGI